MDMKSASQNGIASPEKLKKPRWVAPSPDVVSPHKPSDARDQILAYLKAFGYIGAQNPGNDEDFASALKKFQAFSGLKDTGIYDKATAALMSQPRCANMDSEAGVQLDFVLAGSKWNHTNLTYRFDNFTPDLTPAQVRTCFQGAFGRWESVTPLTFTEVTSGEDITIAFVTGDRGDGTPFDGPWNVLAFTLYPGSGGDSRYDEAEEWTEFMLSQVVLHEMGHALGLKHSTVPAAVMWPYYDGSHPELHEDDMAGIHSIYGWRNPKWEILDNNPKTTGIVAVSNDLYQFHPGQIWKYIGPPMTGWQLIGNQPNVAQLVGTTGGAIYQRRTDGGIAVYNGKPMDWSLVDLNPDTVEIQAGGNELYQRHKEGRIYHFTSGTPAWQLIDDNPLCEQITAGGSGQLYQRHTNGDLWRYIGPGIKWELITNGSGPGRIVAADDKLYQLSKPRIWRWSWLSGGQQSQLLDNNPATVGIAASGKHLYQIHDSGRIWRYTGTPMSGWEVMDDFSGTKDIAVNDAGDVYQRHADGQIWRLIS